MFVNLNEEISRFITDKANEYIITNKLTIPIGTQIFSELERVSILLFYPLFDENVNGICVERTIKNERKKFTFINTNNSITKQVYTAAHEIGHIIDIDKKLKSKIEFNDDPELIINRFASELLMPKEKFISEFSKIKAKLIGDKMEVDFSDMDKIIFDLMLLFMVPYRAICYRMGEMMILSSNDVNQLEQYERKCKSSIEKKLHDDERYAKLIETEKKKQFADIEELVQKAADNGLTFKTKIDRIRDLFKDDTQQIGDITIQKFEV